MRAVPTQLSMCGFAAGALLLCLGAEAQNAAPRAAGGNEVIAAAPGAAVPMSPFDRKFIEQATMGAMAEVELGKLAQIKAGSERVKRLGARMVEDHGRTTVELKQLAQIKRIGVPTGPAESYARDVERLSRLSGVEFDRQYLAQMLADHRKDVQDFKRASESAKDSDVKAFADKTLPTLQEHLMVAQSLHASITQARKPNG